jgi:hypothetical protein
MVLPNFFSVCGSKLVLCRRWRSSRSLEVRAAAIYALGRLNKHGPHHQPRGRLGRDPPRQKWPLLPLLVPPTLDGSPLVRGSRCRHLRTACVPPEAKAQYLQPAGGPDTTLPAARSRVSGSTTTLVYRGYRLGGYAYSEHRRRTIRMGA